VLGNTRFISRVEHDISHSFAALTREISCSTLETRNLVFLRTHVLFSISFHLHNVQCILFSNASTRSLEKTPGKLPSLRSVIFCCLRRSDVDAINISYFYSMNILGLCFEKGGRTTSERQFSDDLGELKFQNFPPLT
jgi:hypothetical protein